MHGLCCTPIPQIHMLILLENRVFTEVIKLKISSLCDKSLSYLVLSDSAIPGTIVRQTPLSMEFSR